MSTINPGTPLSTVTNPGHNDLNQDFQPGQTVMNNSPYSNMVHSPQFDFSQLQPPTGMQQPQPQMPPMPSGMPPPMPMPGAGGFDQTQFQGSQGSGQPGMMPQYNMTPPMDQSGQSPQDEIDPATYIRQFLDEKGRSPAERDAAYAESQRRLDSMLPMPEKPRPVNKWERAGAAFGDIATALGQIHTGIRPTMGSGRRRTLKPPVQGTNYQGQLRAREAGEKGQYEHALYQRGLIKAQMTPSMMSQDVDEDQKMQQQKLTAAIGYLNAESKKDRSDRRQNNYMSSRQGLFYDKEGNFIDNEEIHRTYVEGYQAEVSPDPKRAEMAYQVSRGGAALTAKNAESARLSKEANAANLKSVEADRRRGMGVAGDENIAQNAQHKALKAKYIQDGLTEDAAMFKANAAKVYTPGEYEKFQASRKERINQLSQEYDLVHGAQAVQPDSTGSTDQSQATGQSTENPHDNPGVRKVMLELTDAYLSDDIGTIKRIIDQYNPEDNILQLSNDEILAAAKRHIDEFRAMEGK